MHPVCVQVHRLGSRLRSPPPGTQRGGKAGRGPAFPPSAFQPQHGSASRHRGGPSQRRALQRRGKCWAPRATRACGFPAPAAAPTSAQEIRPWGPPSVYSPPGTQGAEGRGRSRSLGAGPGREESAAGRRRGSLRGLPPTRAGARPTQRACPPRRGKSGPAAGSPAPPPPDQSQALGKKPAAACEAEGTDARRAGRGEAPPPDPTASGRAGGLAQAHCSALPLPSRRFSGGLRVTCQAPAKERTELPPPAGELLSLAGARWTICSGRRVKYGDSSGVLGSAGRWAARARPGQGLTAASDSAAARGKDRDRGTGANLRVGVKP